MSQPYFKELHKLGLNLQAVFSIKNLPEEVQRCLREIRQYTVHYNQLVLLGHGGKTLWTEAKSWQANRQHQTDLLIDDYSAATTLEYFRHNYSSGDFELIWPYFDSSCSSEQASIPINFQTLGKIAGWHNDSPFKIGINSEWGSWFAYRAVVLLKGDIEIVKTKPTPSPCLDCVDKPCLSACPANIQRNNEIKIEDCIEYRIEKNSQCKNKCLARLACPVKKEHQYNDEQINYHYSLSMKTIERLNKINRE